MRRHGGCHGDVSIVTLFFLLGEREKYFISDWTRASYRSVGTHKEKDGIKLTAFIKLVYAVNFSEIMQKLFGNFLLKTNRVH